MSENDSFQDVLDHWVAGGGVVYKPHGLPNGTMAVRGLEPSVDCEPHPDIIRYLKCEPVQFDPYDDHSRLFPVEVWLKTSCGLVEPTPVMLSCSGMIETSCVYKETELLKHLQIVEASGNIPRHAIEPDGTYVYLDGSHPEPMVEYVAKRM